MLHYLYTTNYKDPESVGLKSVDTGGRALPDDEDGSLAENRREDDSIFALQDKVARMKIRSPAEIHARIYAIGDKYEMPGLRDCAKQKFDSTIKRGWYPESFLSIIKLAYESCGAQKDGLRTIVCNVALENVSNLKCDSNFVALLQEQREFANDFILAMMEKMTAK